MSQGMWAAPGSWEPAGKRKPHPSSLNPKQLNSANNSGQQETHFPLEP